MVLSDSAAVSFAPRLAVVRDGQRSSTHTTMTERDAPSQVGVSSACTPGRPAMCRNTEDHGGGITVTRAGIWVDAVVSRSAVLMSPGRAVARRSRIVDYLSPRRLHGRYDGPTRVARPVVGAGDLDQAGVDGQFIDPAQQLHQRFVGEPARGPGLPLPRHR